MFHRSCGLTYWVDRPMSEHNRLSEELRTAREELVRRERNHHSCDEGGLTTDIDPAFRRLQTLSDEELATHVERLQRDLDDFKKGVESLKQATENRD